MRSVISTYFVQLFPSSLEQLRDKKGKMRFTSKEKNYNHNDTTTTSTTTTATITTTTTNSCVFSSL